MKKIQSTSKRFHQETRLSEYPAPYPSGWYYLLPTDALAPGDVIGVECLGRSLVVYRGKDSGRFAVLDAHCPHQGANLAGGKVCGDQLACPFHGWRFGGDGRLAAIPSLEKIPRTGVRSHPILERHGMLWMYHDVSGEIVEPPYLPPPVEPLDSGRFVYRGHHDGGEVDMHLCEFAENSVDFQHFQFLHDKLTLPWTQIPVPGFGIRHSPGWSVDPERPFIATFENSACISFLGKPYPKTGATARVKMIGPGGMVIFHFNVPEMGDIILYHTHLPLEPLKQLVRFRWWADPAVPRPLVWYVVGHWISQWKADLEVWENKVFKKKPVLVKIDGPIHRMRAWYDQFNHSAVEAD